MEEIKESNLFEENSFLKAIHPSLNPEGLEYYALLKAQKNNKNFVFFDKKFTSNVKNLTLTEDRICSFYNTRWVRPLEIFQKDKFYFFAGPIKSSHLFQYNFEKLYWLSCLCIISEKRDLIERLFLNNSVNSEGLYSVFLNKNGIWKNYIVDDFFPINIEKYRRKLYFF